MQRTEFLKLIGTKADGTDYIPVACLLQNGYACAGYVHQATSEQFSDVCLLVNARMIDLREPNRRTDRGAIHDFGDFLEEFVVGIMDKKPGEKKKKVVVDEEYSDDDEGAFQRRFAKSIPLTAISFDQIAVVYPVGRIGSLIRQAHEETKKGNEEVKSDTKKVPSFLDFENMSVVVKVLKTKLW